MVSVDVMDAGSVNTVHLAGAGAEQQQQLATGHAEREWQ